ncbi:MAG: glycosyltransferase, partial [Symploca sp. SIO3E6]|nr:glycosyltransferase [Caldora sp. SIO3E6]
DSTLEIVENIPDIRLKVLSYPNAGLPASRNRGIAQARGEYISFLDADDLWTPDKLEAQLQALQANPQAAVAYSWTDFIDEAGQFLRQGTHLSVNGDAYAHLLLINFLENGSNPLIRAQALTKVGGFDESLTNSQDWDMWLRLAAHYHFVTVPSPQVLYRTSAGSMSTNVWRLEAAGLQVLKRAFAKAPESLQHLKPYSFGNFYKYLLFKAIEGTPARNRGLVAAKFLWCVLKNEPKLLKTRYFVKVLLKIMAVILLPPQQAQRLLTKVSQHYNINALPSFRYEPF